jgi:hypothetical protein
MSELNYGGSGAAIEACSKSRGGMQNGGGEEATIGLWVLRSNRHGGGDWPRGAAEAARGARDPLISPPPYPTTLANIACRRRAQQNSSGLN